jgi:hypothetical protein
VVAHAVRAALASWSRAVSQQRARLVVARAAAAEDGALGRLDRDQLHARPPLAQVAPAPHDRPARAHA